MGYLALENTNKYTVINVVNWGFYQTDNQPNDQQTDHQMTIKRPSNDQRMTTNKKDKKVKQDKKVKKNKIQYAEFVSLEEEEYKKLISEHGEEKVNQMVKVLDNYKGAKGVTYKSDYRAILNWVVDRVNNSYSSGGQARTGKKSLFEQGEESRKRQAEGEAETKEIDWDKELEELPF